MTDDIGLSRVSIHGGEPEMIHRWLDREPRPEGLSWRPDGYILYVTESGI
jgi:hypothetical protein